MKAGGRSLLICVRPLNADEEVLPGADGETQGRPVTILGVADKNPAGTSATSTHSVLAPPL
jgi:hypothetical protein